MKSIMTILSVVLITYSAAAQTNNSEAIDLLIKIESTPSSADLCVSISDTNKLVAHGENAVDTLISVLQNNKFGHVAKWSAVMALGEIGNSKASAVLSDVSAKNSVNSHGFYLGNLARNAEAKIQGTAKKVGKFRKYTYAESSTITDCESGKIEIIQ